MRRRVARKVEKRINAGVSCPRRDGRGYTEGTRLRAYMKLVGGRYAGPIIEFHYGPSLGESLWGLWSAYNRRMNELLRIPGGSL